MASGNTLADLRPFGDEQPASAYATLDTRNAQPCLDFDGSTDEEAVWTFTMPSNYSGGGVNVKIHWRATSATSGNVRWQTAFERGTTDIDADSFAAFNSAGGTPNGTSGIETVTTVAHANGGEMDSCVAGDECRFKLRRDADGTSGTDDVATDVEVIGVEIVEQ